METRPQEPPGSFLIPRWYTAHPARALNCFQLRAMTPRVPLAAIAAAFAHVTLLGPAVYPELHPVNICTPSRDAQLVKPGPNWMREGFERAGLPWRSEPTLPTSVMGKVRALFTVASREPDVEPTALFQRARQVVHFSCSASVGLIVASFLSNKRRCAIFAGAMGGGAIATAAFYGAIFCIFRNFLNFGRREKDILDVLGIPEGLVVWSCVIVGLISALGSMMCVCLLLVEIAKTVLPSDNQAVTTARIARLRRRFFPGIMLTDVADMIATRFATSKRHTAAVAATVDG